MHDGPWRYGWGGRSERRLCEEVHLNLAYRDKLVVRFGPRAEFGSGSYASTSFGVTPSQAAAGSLSAFDAKGGLMGAGLELRAVYSFNDRWGIEGSAEWLRLLNDAVDSQVTKAGSADQFKAIVILTRSVNLDF